MQIHFQNAENEVRWARTEGLQTLGQQEIAVRVPSSELDPHNTKTTHLLKFLEDYIKNQPKRIVTGQTLNYGWTTLYFVVDEQNQSGVGTDTLLIEELQYPFSHETPVYVPGIACTAALMQLQEDAMHRNIITGNALYPHRSQQVLICKRITPETIRSLRPLMAHRAWPPEGKQNGWFIGCCDRSHDHNNPDELAVAHLLHLVERFPGLFPYTAMPVGTQIIFEESRAIVFRAGEQNGEIDPGALLTSLP